MEVDGCMSISISVLEINEHDLPVPIGMSQWQDINSVHLFQELTHVGASECRK